MTKYLLHGRACAIAEFLPRDREGSNAEGGNGEGGKGKEVGWGKEEGRRGKIRGNISQGDMISNTWVDIGYRVDQWLQTDRIPGATEIIAFIDSYMHLECLGGMRLG